MFERILIANRGEIAVRVIRTARRLGVETVAVYSDADRDALHVRMADHAVRIGPAPARESYLDGAAIVAAARAAGVQAIHPGYGFLSENPAFVEAVEGSGLVFIGPSAAAIRAMGLKDRAKALMAEAGVPVVPGYHGADQADEVLAREAADIGYPVLIKAVAGGGGKGMRRVDRAGDFAEALTAARAEAKAAFGNADVLIEKYILSPRHIEVQVFGDGTRAVHLYERDCSLQRRHQKVIEEAPAPGMTEAVRAAMGQAAVRAAEAIGYAGAGTIEFIADGAGALRADGFWFMEMNTRLQVEHPVTEAVTGIDLVEWQLRVAAGAPLPCAQGEIALSGHAVEARIYAEDAEAGFLPVTGRLSHVDFAPGARADSGIEAGDAISPHYDPMIAKLIVHGDDREAAIRGLRRALAQTRLAGSVTNLGFLYRLLGSEDFRAGSVDTGLIERELAVLSTPPEPSEAAIALAMLAALGVPREGADGFTLWSRLRWTQELEHAGARLTRHVTFEDGAYRVSGDGADLCLQGITRGATHWSFTLDGQRQRALIAVADDRVTVTQDGAPLVFLRPDPLARGTAAGAGGDAILAPMPGLVRRVLAAAGASVAEGDLLLVLEAMKMEHALRAPRDGVIATLNVTEGAQVQSGDILVALEQEDG